MLGDPSLVQHFLLVILLILLVIESSLCRILTGGCQVAPDCVTTRLQHVPAR